MTENTRKVPRFTDFDTLVVEWCGKNADMFGHYLDTDHISRVHVDYASPPDMYLEGDIIITVTFKKGTPSADAANQSARNKNRAKKNTSVVSWEASDEQMVCFFASLVNRDY